MLRRTALRCCAEKPAAASAATYAEELKPTKLTRGISFQYSKEAQKLEELQREVRSAGITRTRDVIRNYDKSEPAVVSLLLNMPTKVFQSDKKDAEPSKEELAAVYKDYVLPVNRFSGESQSVHATKVDPAKVKKQEANRLYYRMMAWWFMWAMIGSQGMHVILAPDETIPLLTAEELAEVKQAAKEEAAKE
eukprot:TRINITY_DN32304_c0_g1_i1.p1 TRINITY_DN32304_c0_g1~~TRINITY_DN32304_c0_g1_i1.p1  ORF type:complete len:192 (+),score=65.94 TRINITY_DN32304_c0_g1_i1:79-654(+)